VHKELQQRHDLEPSRILQETLHVRRLIGLQEPLGTVDKDSGSEDGEELEVVVSNETVPQVEALLTHLLGGQQRGEGRCDPRQSDATRGHLEPQQMQADRRRALLEQILEGAE